jgi:hypothetical protein
MLIHGQERRIEGIRCPPDTYAEAKKTALKNRKGGYNPLYYVRQLDNGANHCFFACQDKTVIRKVDYLFKSIKVKTK